MKAFRYKEMKIYKNDAGHMTKMAAMPIYGKNPSNFLRNYCVDLNQTLYESYQVQGNENLMT